MLAGIDRYLIRSFLTMFLALIGVAMALLLLERLIRIAELVAGSETAMLTGSMLVANLIPHYLNLALPGAFLISMILTMDRLSRSGEIVALMAAGQSLYRIVLPFLGFSILLAIASILISGFLQPLSRYSYRELVHNLNHQSILTVFKERKFVQFENRIIWTESIDASGHNLGPVFILETAPNGARAFLSSKTGTLNEMSNGVWEIKLHNGRGASYHPTEPPTRYERIDFDEVRWPALSSVDQYRPRGDDERELLLTELLNKSGAGASKGVKHVAAVASFHDRISRAALLLVMPLIAVLLGLNLGRNPRSTGAVIGVLFLLGLQKALEYGLAQAEVGAIAPWMGFWPLVAFVAIAAAVMFFRTAQGKLFAGGKVKSPPRAEDNGAQEQATPQ